MNRRLLKGLCTSFPPMIVILPAISIYLFGAPVLAAPGGADLLAACERSLANGFQGIAGQMCTWYVTPCDCTYNRDKQIPRVCLPATVSVEALAQEVISGLREQAALQGEEAAVAATFILSRTYPCRE